MKRDRVSYLQGQPSDENVIAKCHNINHIGKLSRRMLKNHGCLRKECRFLEKLADKSYWYKQKLTNCIKKLRKCEDSGFIQINERSFRTTDLNKLIAVCHQEYADSGEEPEISFVSIEDIGILDAIPKRSEDRNGR